MDATHEGWAFDCEARGELDELGTGVEHAGGVTRCEDAADSYDRQLDAASNVIDEPHPTLSVPLTGRPGDDACSTSPGNDAEQLIESSGVHVGGHAHEDGEIVEFLSLTD